MMKQEWMARNVVESDYAGWRPLRDGYSAFYGRAGETALPEEITRQTWARFLDAREPVNALVVPDEGRILGLVHTIIHRSTTRLADVCYLQDLFTAPEARGKGVARSLIEAVYRQAAAAGCGRVYWPTQEGNHTARVLYDSVAELAGFIVYSLELDG